MEERNNRLLNAKLNKYIIPGIMMSLALQLGNIVDTIFVSNLIGVEAMSAVTLSLPVETIVQLTGYCLGIGGSIAVGNMLGKRDKEGASKLFSATFIVTLVVGIIFSICALPAAEPVARLLVSGDDVLTGYTRDYIRVSMLGGTGDRNWTDDGQLPWSGESSGAGISLPYCSQCDQSCAGLYIPQIYSSGDYRCILINCSWFPVCNGNFCALYPL